MLLPFLLFNVAWGMMGTQAPTLPPTLVPTSASQDPTAAPTIAPTTGAPTLYIPPCQRNLTLTQIANLISNDASSCPVIIQDFSGLKRVYEMSSFGAIHPHGAHDIEQFCGQDMTRTFVDGPHNFQPFMGETGMLGPYNRSSLFTCVGIFAASTLAPSPPTPAPAIANFSLLPCLSLGKEYQMRQAILNKFHSIPVSLHNEKRAAFNGGVVRLAFHDAATYSRISNDGGADGCINLADHDNAGLKVHVDMLEELWTPFKERISRADFWYLAAVTAIENAGGPRIPFRYGRQDCTAETLLQNNGAGRLPLANRDWKYVQGLFQFAMGLSDREITALMGAHVLGRAHPENSGFDGPWVSGPSPGMLFSNQFYLALQTVEWVKFENNYTGFTGKFQWNQEGLASGGQMFLTSDVLLLLTNADDPACTSSLIDSSAPVDVAVPKDRDCIKNDATFPIVDEYSRIQANFYRDFAAVYQKVSELGYGNGSLIPPGTCFPGALIVTSDPPVPLPPSPESDTIGGMPVAGFAVLIIVLVLLVVVALLWARHWHNKRALQPLNETEAELIKQTSRSKANSPKPADRKPTIVIAVPATLQSQPVEAALGPADVPPLPSSLPQEDF
jgi:hypothetical protein